MNQDYSDLLSIFNAFRVRYLLVGAYAVMHYTEPRFTRDIDLWIEPEEENSAKGFAALAEFGAPLRGVRREDFCDEDLVYQIGVAPNRIDIMMQVPGLRFRQAWERSVETHYGEEPIRVLCLDDIIRAKEAAGREEDRIDLRRLREAKASG